MDYFTTFYKYNMMNFGKMQRQEQQKTSFLQYNYFIDILPQMAKI